MSGALQGFTDPSNWHGSGLLKNLIGLPIAGAIGSPQWIRKNPQSALAAAAIAATVLSAGAAAPAIGAATAGGEAAGAGAAGLGAGGAAEMGAGAAGGGLAGSSTGLIGAGGLNAMTGAAVGADGLLNTLPYAGELASVGDAGGTMLGGAAPQVVTPQGAGLLGQIHTALNSPTGKAIGKGFQTYMKTQSAINSLSQPAQGGGAVAPAHRPQFGGAIIGQTQLDQPPSTPYSPYDPLWVAYLQRHPQGANYG